MGLNCLGNSRSMDKFKIKDKLAGRSRAMMGQEN